MEVHHIGVSFNRRTEGFEPSDRGAVPRTPSIFELLGHDVISNIPDSESGFSSAILDDPTISCSLCSARPSMVNGPVC